MNYTTGKKHMINLYNEIPSVDGRDKEKYTHSFSPHPKLLVQYPGRLKPGDYRMILVETMKPPTHPQIAQALYKLVNSNTLTFKKSLEFLSDVYYNGTDTLYTDPFLNYLQHVIFWVTLQEEINFPHGPKLAGKNLAFCRFIEAIYCTQPDSEFSLNDVKIRCNNHGGPRPTLYPLKNAPVFYRYLD